MKKDIYKITINNWEKYNAKKKKGHESIMLSCRFFDDAKIMRLTPHQRLIYIRLLTVAGDFTSRSIEVHPEMIARSCGVPLQIIARSLIALEENQLLTYEIEKSLKEEKRREKKRKEKKRKELPHEKKQVVAAAADSDKSEQLSGKFNTSDLIKIYCDQWKISYNSNINPIIDKISAKRLKDFLQSAGKDRAVEIVLAYLKMPDKWFLTKKHDIQTMLTNTNSIIKFMETGKIVTGKELSNIENNIAFGNLINEIKENGI